jgi:hypothetical protein
MEQSNGTLARKRSRWAGILLGRLVQRGCPYSKECQDESCQLRYYCKCAAENERAATRLENALWGVVAVSTGAMVLYWLVAP